MSNTVDVAVEMMRLNGSGIGVGGSGHGLHTVVGWGGTGKERVRRVKGVAKLSKGRLVQIGVKLASGHRR